MSEITYESPSLGKRSITELISDIVRFVEESPESFYRLVIGTDSLVKNIDGKKQCDFVTAVVIHRVGEGAHYYWKKEKMFRAPSLREKIYTETLTSLKEANILVPRLREELQNAHYELEIHIDVGSKGPTREMIHEVVGMVTGNGYVAKTKPESWAASTVADKYT